MAICRSACDRSRSRRQRPLQDVACDEFIILPYGLVQCFLTRAGWQLVASMWVSCGTFHSGSFSGDKVESVSQSVDWHTLPGTSQTSSHSHSQHLQNLDFFYVSKLYFLTFFIAGRIINVSTIKSKYVTAASIFGIDSPFVAGLYIWNLWCVLKTCIKSGQVSFLFFFFFFFKFCCYSGTTNHTKKNIYSVCQKNPFFVDGMNTCSSNIVFSCFSHGKKSKTGVVQAEKIYTNLKTWRKQLYMTDQMQMILRNLEYMLADI